MRKILFIVSIIFFQVNFSFAQEYEWRDGKTFTNPKVILKSGDILKGSSLTVHESSLILSKGSAWKPTTIALADIDQVQVATRNSVGIGVLAGGAVGAVTMLLVEKKFEEPKTTTENWTEYTWYGHIEHTVITTKTKKMALAPKLGIVAGGIVVGTLVGSMVKGGWEKIYPAKEANNNVSARLCLAGKNNSTPVLTMQFRF